MICAFQLVDMENGCRSPVYQCTRGELARCLVEQKDHEKFDKTSVLVVAEYLDSEEWKTSQAPILHAATFIQYFGDNQHG